MVNGILGQQNIFSYTVQCTCSLYHGTFPKCTFYTHISKINEYIFNLFICKVTKIPLKIAWFFCYSNAFSPWFLYGFLVQYLMIFLMASILTILKRDYTTVCIV